MLGHFPLKKIIKYLTAILLLLQFNPSLFAQEETGNQGFIGRKQTPEARKNRPLVDRDLALVVPKQEENLNEIRKMARAYRQQGIELQRAGNLDGALSIYQKAVVLDPLYPAVYNDLGVIYEAAGMPERAEESYLKCIQLDSNYFSAYSNLALLYESRRDFKKAAFYWEKRAKLGLPDDPWTEKAQQRLDDLYLILGEKPRVSKEEQVLDLVNKTKEQKAIFREDDNALAEMHLQKAKLYYQKGNELDALGEAVDAQQLNPNNSEIQEFVDKVQTRLLSR